MKADVNDPEKQKFELRPDSLPLSFLLKDYNELKL
jgi:hypothetical protein